MSPLVLLAVFTAQPAGAAITLPDQPALTEAVAARDAELFELLFLGCDPARMRTLLAPDLEFYHDRSGVMRGADEFVTQYARNCEERRAPDAWRSRRELVPASLHVDPVPGHGAIETGEHLFYERRGDGPERLAGRARFANLWVLGADGQWRLSRVFSYAHGPAGGQASAPSGQ